MNGDVCPQLLRGFGAYRMVLAARGGDPLEEDGIILGLQGYLADEKTLTPLAPP